VITAVPSAPGVTCCTPSAPVDASAGVASGPARGALPWVPVAEAMSYVLGLAGAGLGGSAAWWRWLSGPVMLTVLPPCWTVRVSGCVPPGCGVIGCQCWSGCRCPVLLGPWSAGRVGRLGGGTAGTARRPLGAVIRGRGAGTTVDTRTTGTSARTETT